MGAIVAILSPVLFSFQNFRHHETPLNIEKDESSTTQALANALKTAESEKIVALNRDTEDKKETKKVQKPSIIGDEQHFLDSRHELESEELNSEGVRAQMSSHLTEE